MSETPPALQPKWAGRFDTHAQWVAWAQSWLRPRTGALGEDVRAVCVDAVGRRCNIGADFARARDEGTFPVWYFWECEPAPDQAQLEALREALKPLADCEIIECDTPLPYTDFARYCFSMGEIRAARAALASKVPETVAQ